MANHSDDDGAANNDFDRRSLHQWEGRLLHAAGYMAPPDFRAPERRRHSHPSDDDGADYTTQMYSRFGM
jgi:hypothetical protein